MCLAAHAQSFTDGPCSFYSRSCQTAAASPAEPGGLPHLASTNKGTTFKKIKVVPPIESHRPDDADPEYGWRLTESAVGAHLLNGASVTGLDLQYWRERNVEDDFVLRAGLRYTALEAPRRGSPCAPCSSAREGSISKTLTTSPDHWLER